LESLCMW